MSSHKHPLKADEHTVLSPFYKEGKQSQKDKTTLPRSGRAAVMQSGSIHGTSDPSLPLTLPGYGPGRVTVNLRKGHQFRVLNPLLYLSLDGLKNHERGAA